MSQTRKHRCYWASHTPAEQLAEESLVYYEALLDYLEQRIPRQALKAACAEAEESLRLHRAKVRLDTLRERHIQERKDAGGTLLNDWVWQEAIRDAERAIYDPGGDRVFENWGDKGCGVGPKRPVSPSHTGGYRSAAKRV